MLQKVIKIGNSLGFIIPKPIVTKLKLESGDKMYSEINETNNALIFSKKSNPLNNISPDIVQWTKKFIHKNRKALEALADNGFIVKPYRK
jgi:putative addiction module antidote